MERHQSLAAGLRRSAGRHCGASFGAAGVVLCLSAGSLGLVAGCSYREITSPPEYSEQPLASLCDIRGPLAVSNQGVFANRYHTGELLLAGQLSAQPVENLLGYRAVRLNYLPESGLEVTLIGWRGDTQVEVLPADWIHCAADAMEIDLPSDAFYIWASVGVHNRRLRLQTTQAGGLVLQHLWEEKGMAAVVIPLKISGDGWASFPAEDLAAQPALPPPVTVGQLGECQDLSGEYSVDGTSVSLDGSLQHRTVEAQFFRPEAGVEPAAASVDGTPKALRVSHAADGGIDLVLLLPDDSTRLRHLDAGRVSCEQQRWQAKGAKDLLPALMLITGSAGATWEDLSLWRDSEGALMVRGTYRTRGVLFLIPTGTTSELFMRFALLPGPESPDDTAREL